MAEALAALGFNFRVFVLNVIAFVILFLVLRRYLFRPLRTMMRLRAQEIAAGLDAAQKSKTALTHVEEERDRLLAEAREQSRARVRQAVREADETRERLLAEAREEAQHIRTRGHEVVAMERDQAILEVRRTVVDLALLAASQAVLQRMDERSHRQAVEEFLAGLERAQ
jgi:F-type H+-transporting ATPase subunit b